MTFFAFLGALSLSVLAFELMAAIQNAFSTFGSNPAYFNSQRPGYAQLISVSCGRHQGRPACFVTARTHSAGYLLSARWVTVRAIGYLAHGVTREDQ